MKAKNIAILLFSAVIGCAVAKTYSSLQEEGGKTTDVRKERKTNVKKDVVSESDPTVEHETESVQTEVAKPSYGEYASLQKSGVVGLYGGNSIDNPEDNIFEVVIPSSFSSSDKVVLSYDVEGVAGSTGVALSINDRTAMGGMVAYSSDKRSSVSEEIDAAWLVKGKNRIMFTLPDSANYGYKVSNLKIAISANTASGNIVATASKLDGDVYVRGFVRNSSAKSVNIAGKEYELTHGSFEALISGDDEDVRITCGDASKTFYATTVPGCSASTRLMCANKAEKQTQKEFSLAKKENNKLENEAATLAVDSGVAKHDMKITMTNLRHKDLPALDLGMTNVTDGVEGYRFLPHGAHFDGEGAVVSLKYDRTKIPSGYTENDIRTYYFDLDTKHWVALKRDSIDKENNLIVSRTNHFTDMINGVIQAPESPETQGFTPTMMSDLKLADPTAKIQSIAPPTANNRGSANLSYSFEMPPARHGMQPSLGIQYNSDGGTGLLGEGWDLSVPTISVETRWGVPRYDDILETETYLMDGSMLVLDNGGVNYLAHRALNQIKRSEVKRTDGAVTFHPRKEGSFSKIVRLGNSPAEYTWVVTDKSGTKYYYGKKNADGSMKGVLMGKNYEGKDVIAEWKLVRIQEVHGDWIEYGYEETNVDKFSAKSLRLSSVSAGNSGEKAHTAVKISYANPVIDENTGKEISPKTNTSGRYGFLSGQDYLLTKVDVYFGNDTKPLRSYKFGYTKGQFEAVLLSSVRHLSGDKEVSANKFDYHNDLSDSGDGFRATETIEVSKGDKIEVYGPEFLAKITNSLSPLGMSSSLSGSVDVYGGVGLTDGQFTSKSNSAGVTYTFGYSSSKGAISYMDIDGDGLSDMVFKSGDNKRIYYRPCLPKNTGFGDPIPVEGISELSESHSITNTVGGKGHVGIGDAVLSLGGDYGFSEATTTVYFSDVNGDGLVDLVTDEEVLFNRLVWSENYKRFVPVFKKGSLETANPINTSGFKYTIDQDKKNDLNEETKENAKQNPMHDVVRVWVAPYDGNVTFSGKASLVGNNSDGVVLSVQNEGTLIKRINITDKNTDISVSSTAPIPVKKGDRLFFRIQSGDKFDSNGEDDKVVWSPVVSYVEDFGKDVNGLSLSTYDSEKDFLLQMNNYSSLEPLNNNNEYNKARFVLDVNKKVDLTDVFSILVSIMKKDIKSDTGDDVVVESITYDFDEKSGNTQKTIENLFSYMEDGYVYSLSCELKTKSNIDFGNIEVLPRIEYSNPTMSTPDIKKLVPGYMMYAKNVYYGTSKEIIPVISGFGEANSGWMEGLSVTEPTEDTDPLFVWEEEHLTRVDKDNKEEKESVEISVPVSSVMSDLYVVPQFEYTEETENIPVRLVVKKDGKCEHISFGVKDGAYEPVRLQKENSLLSEYLLGNDGETYSGVWLEYYPDTEDGVFEKTVTKSELRVYAKHTTDYTYTVEDAEGNETTETKSCTVSLYDSKLENIAFQAAVSDFKYGPMYRNWGQFGYIANEYEYEADGENGKKTDVRYENPLDLKYLTNDIYSKYQDQFKDLDPENLDENSLPKMDENENAFVTMTADADLNMWVGVPKDMNGKSINGVGKSDMWASRSGKQDVEAKDPMARFSNPISENSAVGIDLVTKSTSGNANVGLGAYSLNIGWNGDGNTKTGFVDMNGDSYPDVIENGRIRFTNQRGGFAGAPISSSNLLDASKSQGLGLGKGQSINMFPCNSKANEAAAINQDQNKQELSSESSCSFGGRIQREYNEYAMVDMNGDGLPDKVRVSGDKLKVSLNRGYGFDNEFDWDKGCIRKSLSFSLNGGLGAGFSWSAKSISGGLSTSSASTNTMRDLIDVNGDGLPDMVVTKKIDLPGGFPMSLLKESDRFNDVVNDIAGDISEVYINTGTGFEKIGNYGVPLLGNATSTSGSINGNFSVGFPVWLVKIVASGGGAASGSYSTTDCMLSDYDGDGFLDVLMSDATLSNMKLKVQLSKIRSTNKLKSVTTPFGGTYELEYTHSIPTQDHPGGKWVMSKLTVKDNIRDEKDCPPVVTEFDYDGGTHDRRERDFYGFAEVRTKRMNAENQVESQIVQNYDVTNYYSAGTAIGSYVCDANNKLFSKETTENRMFEVSGQGSVELASLVNENSRIFVAPVKTTSRRYENNVEDGVVTNIVENEYGEFGNLVKYTYTDGIVQTSYTTNIKYKPIDEYGVFGLPTDVTVVSDGKTKRHVSAEYDDTGYNPGSMTSITQDLGDESATTEFKYDTLGNIIEKIMPEVKTGDNLMKERMKYTYEYDKKYKMYPIRVTDGFGYRSDMFNYDYRYGIPLSVKDMNGFITEYEIDDLGRTTRVITPNEMSSANDDNAYTIKYEYGVNGNLCMAKTYHYDSQHPKSPMITVNLVDGLGRVLQARKNAEVKGNSDVMIVSGKTVFDVLGREISHFSHTTCGKGDMDKLECKFGNDRIDFVEYDVFDRPMTKTLFDDDNILYETKIDYTIDDSKLATTIIDPEGMKVALYSDGTGHTLKAIKYHKNEAEAPAVTKFAFDGIGQLMTVTDDKGGVTTYEYDIAGRKLSVTHPSVGKISYTYDNLDNLLTKTMGKGDVMTYKYEYNRLVEQKNGDDKWRNKVTLTYGGVDAKHNRVGRLALVEDGSGAQEYFYGKMGEVEKIRRTIIIPGVDIATYTAEWKFDSWHRVQEMIYPDGEKIKYYYNMGGLLNKITGEKNYLYTYVDDIQYDEYEQRSLVKYGNGTTTEYKYENVLHRLDTMRVSNKDGLFLNNKYSYDKVNNVLGVKNSAALNVGIGGTMIHTYEYDDWHRLKTATGTFESADGQKRAEYKLDMGYDNLYNITSKKLTMSQTNLQFAGTLSAGHEFIYRYSDDNPMQLASVMTKQYNVDRTNMDQNDIFDPEKELLKNIHTQNYEFDENGNMTSVYVASNDEQEVNNDQNPENQTPGEEQQASEETEGKDVLKSFLWDEENRLLAANNNGSVSCYFYDAAGERTVKLTSETEMVHVNGKKVGGNDNICKFTAYVSPYFVVSNGGAYTKHIYAANQRIASKLGNVDGFGADPRRVEMAGGKKISDFQKDKIGARFEELGFTYSAPEKEKVIPDSTVDSEEKESLVFYYHPDHLGSTSYVTDADGNIAQHVEYIPYGEIFVEERNNQFSTNYLFNAKELDNETGLYYYGARYLDPTGAMWLSVDPLFENYPGMSPYNYCKGNPVVLIDPDGLSDQSANLGGPCRRAPNGHNNIFYKAGKALKNLFGKLHKDRPGYRKFQKIKKEKHKESHNQSEREPRQKVDVIQQIKIDTLSPIAEEEKVFNHWMFGVALNSAVESARPIRSEAISEFIHRVDHHKKPSYDIASVMTGRFRLKIRLGLEIWNELSSEEKKRMENSVKKFFKSVNPNARIDVQFLPKENVEGLTDIYVDLYRLQRIK